MESKLESLKERNEKGHEQLRDHVSKVKDTLESKVDQVTQFYDKIEKIKGELKKLENLNNNFQLTIIDKINA